ncbi:uncharacterized protein [Littorina saxatilis]|uniref:uncharacterized protein n=1 Tax=Littorina saxatilis TaxID=31220 RepID=UPI0038B562E2
MWYQYFCDDGILSAPRTYACWHFVSFLKMSRQAEVTKYIGVLNVKGSDTNAAAGYQEREGKQATYYKCKCSMTYFHKRLLAENHVMPMTGYSPGQDPKLNQHNSDAFFHGFHKSLSPIAGIAYR